MKILLREYNRAPYVWVTAKYNENQFVVNGERIHNCRIVSVINDNRKNYIQCSCCGQTFKRGSRKFQIHKENAKKSQTCLNCPSLKTENERIIASKYTMDENGNATQILERSVRLVCGRYGYWEHPLINSEDAVCYCKKRQCENATEVEIVDFFTEYPGAFDDIITVDKLLDMNIPITLKSNRGTEWEFAVEDEYTIGVYVNRLGIVDHFFVWFNEECYIVYYSKKYNEIYWDCGTYMPFYLEEMDDTTREEIKEEIAKLYR